MARLIVSNENLTLSMSRVERLMALHVDVAVPLASVTAVRAVEDVWGELRGVRAPGTGLPGRLMFGTTRGSFGRDFCAVRRHGPGVIVELDGQPFKRLVVSDDQALATAGAINAAV